MILGLSERGYCSRNGWIIFALGQGECRLASDRRHHSLSQGRIGAPLSIPTRSVRTKEGGPVPGSGCVENQYPESCLSPLRWCNSSRLLCREESPLVMTSGLRDTGLTLSFTFSRPRRPIRGIKMGALRRPNGKTRSTRSCRRGINTWS